MVFNSYTFVVFLACVLAIQFSPLSWKVRKGVLLIASYLFYAAWNPPFVALLWLSTVVDWFLGRGIYRCRTVRTRRLLLACSLAVNLGLLAFFKYGNFVLENFIQFLAALNIEYQPPPLDIILPVGISFYTFQTLSYTLDIYRRQLRPADSFLDYALYVTFFPQLVAGPIVRARDFLPQCVRPPRVTRAQFSWGISLLVIGLFEKVVVADTLLAPVAEKLYGEHQVPTFAAAWTGTLAFAGQIFCDFAGYSSCAIGVAMCLGFSLPDNFRFPYAAIGFSDFWRRWHISLSTWLRDYLYIPLGGNRHGPTSTQVNLMLTMLIGGLWHGPAWTFVFWGGLHGLYLAAERLLRGSALAQWTLWSRRAAQFALAMATFALVCFTWVFFRAQEFGQAFSIAGAMLGVAPPAGSLSLPRYDQFIVAVVMAAILTLHWRLRDDSLEAAVDRLPWWVRSGFLAAMLIGIAISSGEDRSFIYFQF